MADQHHQHQACRNGDQAKEEEEEDTAVGGLCGLLIKKVGHHGHHDDDEHDQKQQQQIPTDHHRRDVPVTTNIEEHAPPHGHLHDQGEVKHGGNPSLADRLHLSHPTADEEVKHGGNPSLQPDADHQLHPSHGGSPSDEEEGEKKEKIKSKLTADHHYEKEHDQAVAVATADDHQHHKGEEDHEVVAEEKGFLEKFMDKLPLYGQEIHLPDDHHHHHHHHHDIEAAGNGAVLETGEGHKERGILEKIKEKIPHVTGSHKTTGDDHSEAKKDD